MKKGWMAGALLPIVLFAGCQNKTDHRASVSSSKPPVSTQSSATASAASSATSAVPGTYFSTPEVADICGKAQTAYMANQYDMAMNLANQAIASDSQCFQAYNIKGAAYYFQNGNTVADKALALINQSLAINPNYDYGYFNRALIYKGLKQYTQSIADFQKNIAITPTAAWAYYGIATIYADTKQTDPALSYLQKAINLDNSIKQTAKEQNHWDNLRSNAAFQALVN
ncbi:MAG: hypothetical protein ABF904_03340 [Ethanoligenens sp.]